MDWASAPSSEPREEFHKGLADLIDWHEPMREEFFLPLYKLGLRDLQAGMGIDAAGKQIGWRAVACDHKGGVYLCDMSLATPSEPAAVISVTQGERAQKAYDDIRRYRAQPDLSGSEMRWLSIPGLCTECVWMQPPAGQSETVQMMFTLDQQLLEQPQFPVASFVEIIRKLADIRLAWDDTPRYQKDYQS
jgi:hypothetical protein